MGINFLEKLYSSATSVGADISICDYKAVIDDTGIEKEETNIEVFDNVKCLEEMYHPQKHGMEFVAWGKLYRTALFKKNKIEYPVGKIHEDTFTTYKLIYAAPKIVFCTSTALIITQIFVEGTLGKLQWRRDYEHDITYHGRRNWQPIWNRNKTVGTGR